ncbi:MAG: hypothetical protein ABIK62_03865 [candidate division WOR-3 bacterium]
MKAGNLTLRLLFDDRGAAALEGIVAVALMGGLFLACLVIAQWGTNLQTAQLGARLLAFDAGDTILAKLGRQSNRPMQLAGSEEWDTLVHTGTSSWLNGMFALHSGYLSGSVTGTTGGRLPGQSALFAYTPASLTFNAHGWNAVYHPWTATDSATRLKFLRLAYHVGLFRTNPAALDSTAAQPIPHADTVLETIYRRAGVR